MRDIVDKQLWTIIDFPELADYVASAEFTPDPLYDEHKRRAMSGESNPTYPGQQMPIFRAGKSTYHFRTAGDKPNYPDYDAAVDFFEQLRNDPYQRTAIGVPFDVEPPELLHNGVRSFEMPSSDSRPSARIQEDSLLYHASLFKTQKKEFKFPDEWLDIVAQRWPSTADEFKDWIVHFDRLYDKAVDAVTKTSSTGCSISLGPTKGGALKANGNTCKVLVFQRLLLLMTTPREVLEAMSPLELVRKGYVDAIRVFLKREPHKYGKRYDDKGNELPLKRWRIISSCSLVDELVDRLLYTLQNKAEIRRWFETPSMPGVGFSDDVSSDTFFYRVLFAHAGKDFSLLDFSGWDWGLKQDMLNADADVRSNRCGGKDLGTFHKRALTIGFSVFVLDDGTYYEQCVRGIMKSGWLNTSATNSRDRSEITLLAEAQYAAENCGSDDFAIQTAAARPILETFFIVAMGDDSVEEKHAESWDGFIQRLDDWGLRPDPKFTGELVDVKHINFCSHNFDIDDAGRVKANLRNHAKAISKFLFMCRSKRQAGQIAGIRNALRHTPELPYYEAMWQHLMPELWEASWDADSGEYVV